MECEFCGKQFSNSGAKANHIKARHPEKFDEVYKTKLECENCGKIFLRRKSKVGKSKHVFCSKECEAAWKGNGDEDYPAGWNLISERIRKRDDYKCQECGKEPPSVQLQVHHIDGDRSNNEFDNLVTLCASCHNKAERKLSGKCAEAHGFSVDERRSADGF